MTGMPRALRCVLLAALVVSALILGAVSVHAMSANSPAMVSATHVMSVAPDTASTHDHEHGSAGATAQPCDGMCEAGHALVAVLCVVAGVAMLLLVLLPRAAAARVILSSLVRRTTVVGVTVRATGPSLVQLSISRT